jgi:hypothetical protein
MRLKELSFPAMKLSALIAIEGKKIIVAITAFYPNIAMFIIHPTFFSTQLLNIGYRIYVGCYLWVSVHKI